MKQIGIAELVNAHIQQHLELPFSPNKHRQMKEIGELDQTILAELISLIKNNIGNIALLSSFALQFLSDKTLCYHKFLIESEFFPQILRNSLNTMPNELYSFLAYLIFGSETLVISTIRQGILLPLFQPFSNPSPAAAPNVHGSLKVLRRMILTGPAARAFLFTAGFFKEMYHFLQLQPEICSPHFPYIAHTISIFAAGIPTYDYATFTSKNYKKRKNIIDAWKEFALAPPEYSDILSSLLKHVPGESIEKKFSHSVLILTNFLKYGNIFQINRELWHLINLFLPIPTYSGPPLTEKTLFHTFQTFSILSHNSQNIQNFYDFSITNFLKINPEELTSMPNLIACFYHIIVELVLHCNPKEINFLEKKRFINYAAQFLFNEDPRLQILGARILTNALEKDESFVFKIILANGSEFISNILSIIDEAPFALRQELSWFLVVVLNSIGENDRRSILSGELFQFLLDMALGATNEMGAVTLELFTKFFAENIEIFSDFIKSEEIISDIEELSESGNENVQALASQLIRLINEP